MSMRVGFVGWRGMVGSVLLQRMAEMRDFDTIEPVFFSTSRVGAEAPAIGGARGMLQDAHDAATFRGNGSSNTKTRGASITASRRRT